MRDRNTIAGMALAVIVALVVIMPLTAHAIPVTIGRDGFYIPPKSPPPPPSNTGSSGSSGGSPPGPTPNPPNPGHNVGPSSSGGSSNSGSPTIVTITKTYTQVVTKTYVINHYIYYYMYPTLKWVFTLVNIGYEQALGYHSVSNQLVFTPGFGGGSGIFVPVYAQEAIYSLNIAPSTKPVITGWYVGGTSESSTPPQLVSVLPSPPVLSGIQKFINSGGTGNSGGTNITKYVFIPGPGTVIYKYIKVPIIKWNNNTQYLWIIPYFYSKQDIITAFTDSAVSFGLGYQYAMKAGQDLLSGNWGQAVKDLFTSSYLTGLGLYQAARGAEMVAWNYLIAYPTLAWEYIVSDPNTPWSIAHALGVTGTMASFGIGTAVSALEAAGSYIVNWFSHL